MSVGAPNRRLHHSDEQYLWKYIISRLPQGHCEMVQQEYCDMLAHGMIETSSCDWASPILLVKKKDGSLRLCVDYQ